MSEKSHHRPLYKQYAVKHCQKVLPTGHSIRNTESLQTKGSQNPLTQRLSATDLSCVVLQCPQKGTHNILKRVEWFTAFHARHSWQLGFMEHLLIFGGRTRRAMYFFPMCF